MQEKVLLSSTISTLQKYSRNILNAAISDRQSKGWTINPATRGLYTWINAVIASLSKISKNLRTNTINLNHLRDYDRNSVEYKTVADAIKCFGVAETGVILVAWVIIEHPNEESLLPNRHLLPSGVVVYQSPDYSAFKKRFK